MLFTEVCLITELVRRFQTLQWPGSRRPAGETFITSQIPRIDLSGCASRGHKELGRRDPKGGWPWQIVSVVSISVSHVK